MNTCVHVMCEHVFSVLLSVYLGVELLHFIVYLIVK